MLAILEGKNVIVVAVEIFFPLHGFARVNANQSHRLLIQNHFVKVFEKEDLLDELVMCFSVFQIGLYILHVYI